MRLALALASALVASCSQPALAWAPFGDDFDPGIVAPADPAPFVVPEGLYVVTDVYAGDVVSTYDDTTMYSTSTIHETPGTYARVIDVVGSGSSSTFDGASFNGRGNLPDGRPVGGTYYEDFVLAAGGRFVSVNIVFFQDDSATRSTTPIATSAPPSPAPTHYPTPAITPPPTVVTTPPTVVTTPPPVVPTPVLPTERAEPSPPPAARVATAGVALAAGGPVLGSIDVLRGRLVHLWPRVFVDGRPVAVSTWRLVSGQVDIASRHDGIGGTACDATWLVPTAGTSLSLRFEVTSDATPGRVLPAVISVTVRSPALGE